MNIYWEEHKMKDVNLGEKSSFVDDSFGGYKILNHSKKPNWFRRFFVRLFFGWVWIDKKEDKGKQLLKS